MYVEYYWVYCWFSQNLLIGNVVIVTLFESYVFWLFWMLNIVLVWLFSFLEFLIRSCMIVLNHVLEFVARVYRYFTLSVQYLLLLIKHSLMSLELIIFLRRVLFWYDSIMTWLLGEVSFECVVLLSDILSLLKFVKDKMDS